MTMLSSTTVTSGATVLADIARTVTDAGIPIEGLVLMHECGVDTAKVVTDLDHIDQLGATLGLHNNGQWAPGLPFRWEGARDHIWVTAAAYPKTEDEGYRYPVKNRLGDAWLCFLGIFTTLAGRP